MKKARANTTNDYWDKKLIEAEEKDPNRWRHTGYKKMYIQGESSSGESDRDRDREREGRDLREGREGRDAREGGAPPTAAIRQLEAEDLRPGRRHRAMAAPVRRTRVAVPVCASRRRCHRHRVVARRRWPCTAWSAAADRARRRCRVRLTATTP